MPCRGQLEGPSNRRECRHTYTRSHQIREVVSQVGRISRLGSDGHQRLVIEACTIRRRTEDPPERRLARACIEYRAPTRASLIGRSRARGLVLLVSALLLTLVVRMLVLLEPMKQRVAAAPVGTRVARDIAQYLLVHVAARIEDRSVGFTRASVPSSGHLSACVRYLSIGQSINASEIVEWFR